MKTNYLRRLLGLQPAPAPVTFIGEPPIIDLSTKDGYEIAAAIRGPDLSRLGLVKWVFTARIRHLAGAQEGSIRTLAIDEREAEVLLNEVAAWRDRYGDNAVRHFFSHTASAATALGAHDLARLARDLQRDEGEVSLRPHLDLIVVLAGGGR